MKPISIGGRLQHDVIFEHSFKNLQSFAYFANNLSEKKLQSSQFPLILNLPSPPKSIFRKLFKKIVFVGMKKFLSIFLYDDKKKKSSRIDSSSSL